MTREEAIEQAKAILEEATREENSVSYVTSDDEEWLEMAIKALEQPSSNICSKIKMDIIQISEDLNYESGDYDLDMLNEAKREALNDVLSIIDKRVSESEVIK